MCIRYATTSLSIHIAFIGTMPPEICESLNSTVNQTTVAIIRQPRTKATNLSFAALDKKLTSSTSSN